MTQLVAVDQVDSMIDQLGTAYISAVRAAGSVEAAQSERMKADTARMALKKYFKTHERAKEAQRLLLQIDAEALARIHELGGADQLRPNERDAAEFYATLGDDARAEFIEKWSENTSAVTAFRAHRAEEAAEAARIHYRETGEVVARRYLLPVAPGEIDPRGMWAGQTGPREQVRGVSSALTEMLEELADGGEPFTVDEVTDELLTRAGASGAAVSENPAFRDGVRRGFAEAVRRHRIRKIGDTRVPAFVTARVADGVYVRVPIQAAHVWHLDDALLLREEQIRADQASLAELREFVDRIKALPGGGEPNAQVGPLIALAASRVQPESEED